MDSPQSSAFPGAGPAAPSPVGKCSEGPGNGSGPSQAFFSDLLQLCCGWDVSCWGHLSGKVPEGTSTACLGGLTALVFQCLQFQHVQSSAMRSAAGEKIEPRWGTSLFFQLAGQARHAFYWRSLGFAEQLSLHWGFCQLYRTGWLLVVSQRARQGQPLLSGACPLWEHELKGFEAASSGVFGRYPQGMRLAWEL